MHSVGAINPVDYWLGAIVMVANTTHHASTSTESANCGSVCFRDRLISVSTLIATIYGMNFTSMPELSWRWGYPAVLCLMVAASTGLYVGFKRSGWL